MEFAKLHGGVDVDCYVDGDNDTEDKVPGYPTERKSVPDRSCRKVTEGPLGHICLIFVWVDESQTG